MGWKDEGRWMYLDEWRLDSHHTNVKWTEFGIALLQSWCSNKVEAQLEAGVGSYE